MLQTLLLLVPLENTGALYSTDTLNNHVHSSIKYFQVWFQNEVDIHLLLIGLIYNISGKIGLYEVFQELFLPSVHFFTERVSDKIRCQCTCSRQGY